MMNLMYFGIARFFQIQASQQNFLVYYNQQDGGKNAIRVIRAKRLTVHFTFTVASLRRTNKNTVKLVALGLAICRVLAAQVNLGSKWAAERIA